MGTQVPTRSQRSETADLVTVMVLGALAALVVSSVTITRLWSAFRDVGFAWTVMIDELPVDATVDSGEHAVNGIASELLLIIPGIDGPTAFAGATSIILWGLTALIVIGVAMFLAWSFLRGRFFVTATARAFDVIGWTLVIGGLAAVGLENMARNGVLAASVGAGGEPLHPLDFWAFAPVWAVGVVMGMLGMAFRRGMRLQHETEGLV